MQIDGSIEFKELNGMLRQLAEAPAEARRLGLVANADSK